MKYKIYDYDKDNFKESTDNNERFIYYIKEEAKHIEVLKEVYLMRKRSYEKIIKFHRLLETLVFCK